MMAQVIVVLGLLVVIAVIGGIVAAFFVHGYLWDRLPIANANGWLTLVGAVFCASLNFAMFWSLNPDPAPEHDHKPTVGGTALMTGMSSLIWLPVYLYAFSAMARRRQHT